jgi:creatinine amidohydrolase
VKKVQFEEMFPWELSQALAEAPIGYVPLGTLEWHGEHNAVGIDAIKAHAICVQVARQSGGVVLPALYWATDSREDLHDGTYLTGGVEHGERYHVPGNMYWLRPQTYQNFLLDVYEAMRRRGFRVIVVVTGHWSGGTLPTIQASGAQFTAQHPEMKWLFVTDQQMATGMHYPNEHAAGGETSLLMAIRPDLVDLSKAFETDRSLRPHYAQQPKHLRRRRETRHKYIGVDPDTSDGRNDPELTASAERGMVLLKVISARISEMAKELLTQDGG